MKLGLIYLKGSSQILEASPWKSESYKYFIFYSSFVNTAALSLVLQI